MTRHVFALAIALLVGPSVAANGHGPTRAASHATTGPASHGTTRPASHGTTRPASHGTTRNNTDPAKPTLTSGFELTVDSIMRGPDLVGYPPTGLRWSADSQKLFFEWRKPGETESSTYVVGRDGTELRQLSDDEVKSTPAANGRWDKAHRRILFVDGGDVVLVDSAGGVRRQITRTIGGESNPRWSRNDTHVTYVRDGNLFIVPVDSASGGVLTQLTDVAPKKTEPRLSDSQKFLRDEEEKLIEYLRTGRSCHTRSRITASPRLRAGPMNTHGFSGCSRRT